MATETRRGLKTGLRTKSMAAHNAAMPPGRSHPSCLSYEPHPFCCVDGVRAQDIQVIEEDLALADRGHRAPTRGRRHRRWSWSCTGANPWHPVTFAASRSSGTKWRAQPALRQRQRLMAWGAGTVPGGPCHRQGYKGRGHDFRAVGIPAGPGNKIWSTGLHACTLVPRTFASAFRGRVRSRPNVPEATAHRSRRTYGPHE
jgi:hypothetical protein